MLATSRGGVLTGASSGGVYPSSGGFLGGPGDSCNLLPPPVFSTLAHVRPTTAPHPVANNHQPSQHVSKVFVEHQSGAFIPLAVHHELEAKQMEDEARFAAANGAMSSTAAWNFDEDAKDYHIRLQETMRMFRRCLDMLSGLACGFSLFKIIDVYGNAVARSDANFLATYTASADIIPKCYLMLTLTLVVLCIVPVAYDLAMESLAQHAGPAVAEGAGGGGGSVPPGGAASMMAVSGDARTPVMSVAVSQRLHAATSASGVGGLLAGPSSASTTQNLSQQQNPSALTKTFGGLQYAVGAAQRFASSTYQRVFQLLGIRNPNDSPMRHMMQVRFVAFVGALGVTILEIAVVDQRAVGAGSGVGGSAAVLLLGSSDIAKLHGAIITRAALLAVGWLFSLKDF